MEIRQLRYFCAVAETGSFTRGARREHVSQPSLSEQIKMLEQELGSDLFDRLGQATKLTATGKTLYRAARFILNRLGEVKSKIQDGRNMQGGDVTVGAPPTVAPYFLPRALVSFKRKHPLIRLKVVEEPSDQLLQDLRSAAVDVAVLQLPVTGSEFTGEELAREPLCVALPRSHRLATRKTVHLAELKDDPFIMLKDGPFRKLVFDALRKARLRPRIACEVHGLGKSPGNGFGGSRSFHYSTDGNGGVRGFARGAKSAGHCVGAPEAPQRKRGESAFLRTSAANRQFQDSVARPPGDGRS